MAAQLDGLEHNGGGGGGGREEAWEINVCEEYCWIPCPLHIYQLCSLPVLCTRGCLPVCKFSPVALQTHKVMFGTE